MATVPDGKQQEELILEQLTLRPPIDQIPDEFPRDSNRNVLVEIVSKMGGQDPEAEEFGTLLGQMGYNVVRNDMDALVMTRKVNLDWLKGVVEKTNQQEYDGLIMVFVDVAYTSEEMKQVWSQFTTHNCPKLKNKPKIFIFQIVKRSLDKPDNTATSLNWKANYETPAEADILIIQDKYDEGRSNLLTELTSMIQLHGYREDITTLTSLCFGYNYQPMQISTMTRKFYFQVHPHRGHHYNFYDKHEQILAHLKQMKSEEESMKKKKEKSFLSTIKKTFSFRKKSQETSKSSVENNTLQQVQENASGVRDIKSKAEPSGDQPKSLDGSRSLLKSTPRANPVPSNVEKRLSMRKQSPSTEPPSTLERKNTKVRTTSTSSDKHQNKPIWKP